jgi:hypothetical protein
MSNMTPFEIRLELLKMAKEMLMDEYYSGKDRLTQDWAIKCDTAKIKGETPPEHPALPSMIKKAQALNGFVSNITSEPPAAKVLKKN